MKIIRPANDRIHDPIIFNCQKETSGWEALSEIVAIGNSRCGVIEPDNPTGTDARIEKILEFSAAGLGDAQIM
jgi:hypothetical protein